MRHAMIMAGGAGTRLWPMSRAGTPKQLTPFIYRKDSPGAVTLLDVAAERLDGIVPPERRSICTGERFRAQIKQRLPSFTDERILGEPAARDTVNAVAFGAAVYEKADPDAVFAVLTADHIITPQDVFARAMDEGFRLVEADPTRLVTFGIRPTFPATGYGYVEEAGPVEGASPLAFRVAKFVEKPELAVAEKYLAAGNFHWNSGMFVFHAGTFLKLLEKFMPENAAGMREIQAAWGTPNQNTVLECVYPTLPKKSVDYGVMEPASTDDSVSICGVRMDVNWLDVGSWPSYGETIDPDARGNRVAPGTSAVMTDCTNTVAVSSDPGHTLALLGCEGLIVVHTPDATLVMPADRAQDLKSLHAELPDQLK
ncbi:MAG: mannose-1-phosphate guanylyltransferase [Phycisphaerales bacterium]